MNGKKVVDRRTYLAVFGVALAGCGSSAEDEAPESPDDTSTPTAGTASDTPATTQTKSPTPTNTDPTTSASFRTPPDLPPATRDVSPIEEDGPAVALEPVATGFDQPVAVEDIPDAKGEGTDDHVRFIADKSGTLHLQDDTGVRSDPVLDVSDDLVETYQQEPGLIGLALHPEFPSTRRYFIRYSAKRRQGTPVNYHHTAVLEEYRATEDLRKTVEGSQRTILEIPQPHSWHNSGDIRFGPDGYLYVALGDGGHESDQGTGHVEGGNGQDITENLLGSILRIDIDREDEGKNYAVPGDNPLVGEDGLDEQYAWGLRNPWRMSFHDDGALFAGDVGQMSYEEVSMITKGANYGWNPKEGTVCHQSEECPEESRHGNPLIDPVIAYSHDIDNGTESNAAVIGGHFYTGDAVPELRDSYVFADHFGMIFAAHPPEEGNRLWPIETIDAGIEKKALGFGRSPDGELYFLAADINAEGTGTVYKIGPR